MLRKPLFDWITIFYDTDISHPFCLSFVSFCLYPMIVNWFIVLLIKNAFLESNCQSTSIAAWKLMGWFEYKYVAGDDFTRFVVFFYYDHPTINNKTLNTCHFAIDPMSRLIFLFASQQEQPRKRWHSRVNDVNVVRNFHFKVVSNSILRA